MTRPEGLPDSARIELAAHRDELMEVYAFGGEAVVSSNVLEQAEDIMR